MQVASELFDFPDKRGHVVPDRVDKVDALIGFGDQLVACKMLLYPRDQPLSRLVRELNRHGGFRKKFHPRALCLAFARIEILRRRVDDQQRVAARRRGLQRRLNCLGVLFLAHFGERQAVELHKFKIGHHRGRANRGAQRLGRIILRGKNKMVERGERFVGAELFAQRLEFAALQEALVAPEEVRARLRTLHLSAELRTVYRLFHVTQ